MYNQTKDNKMFVEILLRYFIYAPVFLNLCGAVHFIAHGKFCFTLYETYCVIIIHITSRVKLFQKRLIYTALNATNVFAIKIYQFYWYYYKNY